MIWQFVGKIAPKEMSNNFMRIELREETVFKKKHFDTAAENARYTSHPTQNDLIKLSEQALREDIVKAPT